MENLTLQQALQSQRRTAWIWLGLSALVVGYFLGVHHLFDIVDTFFNWNWISCNSKNDMIHGRAVPVLFVAFVFMAWKDMKGQPIKPSLVGLVGVVLFILLYLLAVRTKQPRMILAGLPFLIIGCTHFLFGWKVSRYMIFPAFFLYFAMPIPMVQHATNFLQVWVTQMCYSTGQLMGFEIIRRGNEIFSATGAWEMNIAEGCSGIRSLMALVMIAAVFGYYTQKELWKKAVIFLSALPLAMLGNYVRIVTILFFNELGLTKFAAGFYHNWAGILLIFPIALAGLFALDRLLNPSRKKLKKRKTVATRKSKPASPPSSEQAS